MADKSHYDDVYGLYHPIFADVQYGDHSTVSTPRQKSKTPGEARRGSVQTGSGNASLRKKLSTPIGNTKFGETKMSTAPPGSKFLKPAK